MAKIIECVPNISEGRNKKIIDDVLEAIEKSSEDVKILDVSIGADTNRTVITFAGSPDGVEKAAFSCIKKASELIDMSNHHGAHPRQGCVDVCPFIPISDVSMDECTEIAKRVGEKAGKELGVPIYLYGYAASTKERSELSFVRKGEYESLKEKLPKLIPDFGAKEFNDTVRKSGAINISSRDFLIAYNINLNTKSKAIASEIAFKIREAGKSKRNEFGKLVKDSNGEIVKIPGLFKCVKAIGWYIDEYGAAQISINLTNYKITPLHILFEACVKEAELLGVRVTGSEIVGLLPKEVLILAGKYFVNKSKCPTGLSEDELIHIAEKSFGLSEIEKFKASEKIIENRISDNLKFKNMKLSNFINEFSKATPTPGGGSASALAAAIGSALGAMVASLTPMKNGYEKTLLDLSEVGEKLIGYMEQMKNAIDLDSGAFDKVINAVRLPKKTDEDKNIRNLAIQNGYKYATEIPLETAKTCVKVLKELILVAKMGNPNSASDVQVGALLAFAGFEGAVINSEINLSSIEDNKFNESIKKEIDEMREIALNYKEEVFSILK